LSSRQNLRLESSMVAQHNTPQPGTKTICLVMIVRNEAAVMRRCLESVKPVIDYWVICDTGSTDATPEILQQILAGIPGTLSREPWVDFGHNRTQALKLAKGKADYHLLLDADMTLNANGDFREKLSADAFFLRHEGAIDYWIERLVSDRHDWRYVGPTHEYIWSDTAERKAKLVELTVVHHEDGGSRKDKYQRDIQLLKRALDTDPDNARNIFYLAQSYRDIGNLPQAIEWYEKRASLGGWDEEVWYSLYQVARLQHRLGLAWALVLDAYLRAYEFRPTRIEPIYQIARYYRETGQYHLAYLFSRAVIDTPYPEDLLFIEKNIYQHELQMEYALCCEQLGKRDQTVHASERACPSAPDPVLATTGRVQ
jgi:glycosyltransferase involved in cell wall biosynthesis